MSLQQNLSYKEEMIGNKRNEYSTSKNSLKDKDLTKQVNNKKIVGLNQDFDKVSFVFSKLKDELEKENNALKEYEQDEKEKTNQYDTLNNRINFLKSLEEELEGVAHSVKYILDKKPKGVIDILGNLLTVPKDYLLAIDTSLGGALQNIVVEDEDVAKECVNLLKNENKGRATFLPLSAMKNRRLTTELKEEQGFLGLGVDLISFDKKYTAVFENLLGNVAVVKDMESGIEISKKYKQSFRVVTLDGQTFNIGGSITGGSKNVKSNSILARKEELQSGLKKLEKLKVELDAIKYDYSIFLEKNKEKEKLLETYLTKYNDLTYTIKDLTFLNLRVEDEYNSLSENILEIEKSLSLLEKEKEELSVLISYKEEEIHKNEVEHSKLEEEINDLNSTYEKGQKIKNNFFEELGNFKIQLAEISNILNGYYQRIIELKGFIENLEKEIEVWDMDIKKCLEDISTKDTNIV
ncbi:MAG: hypothetical protein ACK5LY_08495, partial [Lachnospirales bacterium]